MISRMASGARSAAVAMTTPSTPPGMSLSDGYASVAFDRASIRVHCEHVVPALAQTLVDHVASVALRVGGDTCDGDATQREELGGGVLDADLWWTCPASCPDLSALPGHLHRAMRQVRG